MCSFQHLFLGTLAIFIENYKNRNIQRLILFVSRTANDAASAFISEIPSFSWKFQKRRIQLLYNYCFQLRNN